jgi:hypothetical protein
MYQISLPHGPFFKPRHHAVKPRPPPANKLKNLPDEKYNERDGQDIAERRGYINFKRRAAPERSRTEWPLSAQRRESWTTAGPIKDFSSSTPMIAGAMPGRSAIVLYDTILRQ